MSRLTPSRRRGEEAKRRTASFLWLALAAMVVSGAVWAGTDVPRYAQRRVYGVKPGPRLVIVALPNVNWRDLRRAEAPNLHKLIENGAVGLMPVAEPGSREPDHTWAALSMVAEAKPMSERLHEVGLRTGLVEGGVAPAASSLVLLDGRGSPEVRVVATDLGEGAIRKVLAQSDVVVIDVASAFPAGRRGRTESYHQLADTVIEDCLRVLAGSEALLVVLGAQAPYYPDPIVHKSLGPILLYDTKHPQRGLLYTHRTRWPGLVTAADFAPTILQWWQIEGVPMGQPMTVRPGGPEELGRLDRTLSEHYAWGFPAVKLYMAFCLAVLGLGLWFTVRRPELLPRLRGPALAIPLIPVALLVAPRVGGGGLYAFLLVSLLIAVGVVYLATRWRRPEVALAIPMLAGALVILYDTLTGAWLTRTAPYAFPVMSGSRFYGLGNEYMGVLLGLSVIGLAAGVQAWPRAERLFAPVAALVVVVIGTPFWGANWGGAVSAAAGLAMAWLFLKERNARWAVPVALGAIAVSALAPAALDLMISPNAAQRTHIGTAFSALLSGQGGSLGAVIDRKLQMSLYILRYTPWTLVLAAAVVGVFWIMLRAGAPARRALAERRPLTAGLIGAFSGGVVAMVVNDSGVVAGAGALAAAMAAVLVLAATPREQAA